MKVERVKMIRDAGYFQRKKEIIFLKNHQISAFEGETKNKCFEIISNYPVLFLRFEI